MNEKRKRIAVVDDETDLAELFSQGLQQAGFKAIAFDDPITALEHIASNPQEFSMVITDWKMPKMNGLEFTKQLSDIDGKIRVMLMSAYDLDQDQLRKVNKDDYLRKPMHIAKLIDSIETALSEPLQEGLEITKKDQTEDRKKQPTY